MQKRYTVSIRAKDLPIFESLKKGTKKVETRASTKRYQHITAGDIFEFRFGNKRLRKVVKEVRYFKSMASLLRYSKPYQIDPRITTKKELEKLYGSFPGYTEKIKNNGIVAVTFV